MTDDARLQRWLASQGGAGAADPTDHASVFTLQRYAAGTLTADEERRVNEHLGVCVDGRCAGFTKSSHVDSERNLLYGGGQDGEPMTERTFQSREIVWSTFESMSRELSIPIDELVNEAMVAYAKVRGYEADSPTGRPAPMAPGGRGQPPVLDRDPLEDTHDAPSISALDHSYAPPQASDSRDDLARTAARISARPAAGRPAILDMPRDSGPESRTTPRLKTSPLPLPAALNRPVGGPNAPPPPMSSRGVSGRPSGPPPPLPPRAMAPGTQRMPDAPRQNGPVEPPRRSAPAPVGEKRLVLSYQGRAFDVDKDQFLIGRSKTQSDLRLDDPNVSRQHAVIERAGAAWYLVDLGSTNGVHIGGERVARRALADGDVLVITSHEIRCSLR